MKSRKRLLVAVLAVHESFEHGEPMNMKSRDRKGAWTFIEFWSNRMFHQQMRLPREVFFWLCERLKSVYPGRYKSGFENYHLALKRGAAATPLSGPVTMELKLCVTLRMLAGAQHLDMIWYGVQLSTVDIIFKLGLALIDEALVNAFIFNFDPNNSNFTTVCRHMATEWSSIMIRKRGHDLATRNIMAGDGMVQT